MTERSDTSTRPRVVIVGGGMAGARVVDDLARLDARRLFDITLIGEEPEPTYNRVLLSEVLAGRQREATISLGPAPSGVAVLSGVAATGIDRDRRVVQTSETEVAYDVLVLATGSRAFVPPIAGMRKADGTLRQGVHAFRTLDDCRRIAAEAARAKRAVVIGGGLLGLEAARGLAGRGLHVVVVHNEVHLMQRQIDVQASQVLRRSLAEFGMAFRLDASTVELLTDEAGAAAGVRLDDGGVVLADLVVVACGVQPEVTLARQAGLAIDRGILVDDAMRTESDRRVYAIGECAQHRGQVHGLVAPAWEQAAVVAKRISGVDPEAEYAGTRPVTRLKAAGIDLAAMGETKPDAAELSDAAGTELVLVSDAARGTYGKLVVREGRLVGAVLIGLPAAVGPVTQMFDRGLPLPAHRTSLLLPSQGGEQRVQADSPARLPRSAEVCRCNGVTKGAIQDCVLSGATTVEQVAGATRATTGCGSCRSAVTGLIDWLRSAEPALDNPNTTSEEPRAFASEGSRA